jgi:translation initiation factor 1
MPNENSKLVYSTDRLVPPKEKLTKKNDHPGLSPAQQKVTVRHDRKRRGGKSVTVVEGIQMQHKEMKSLLKELKAGLGTGGAIKDISIEIQGEHCDAVMAAVEKMGYRPKRSGG